MASVTITDHGHSEIIRGTLALVSGYNLASHYLGDFKSPTGAIGKYIGYENKSTI